MFRITSLWLLALLAPLFSNAQSVALSGVVNRYAAVLGYDSCMLTLQVSDTAGFPIGGNALVFHTQGGLMNTANTAQFGTLTNLQQAGRMEQVEIVAKSAGTVQVAHRLLYPILPDEKVQLVSFPRYDHVVVTDTLRALPWNGLVGGVLAIEVVGVLDLQAPIVADGAGFKGGTAYVASNNNCSWLTQENDYVYPAGTWRSSNRGEGIVPLLPGQEMGRGAAVNGGGGGNDHNSGGGGGANRSNGGQGGENDEPATFGCDGYFPGLGGKAVAAPDRRWFMGGGGGAGHTNNGLSSNGGHGGGVVLVSANTIIGSNPKISANGMAGQSGVGDGGGGGGAGGTIWLSASTVTPNLIVRANGGAGGSASGQNANRCFGPGGGGGGGVIMANNDDGNLLTQGGVAGVVVSSSNACNGTPNAAVGGQDGIQPLFYPVPESNSTYAQPIINSYPVSTQVCQGQTAYFTISTQPEMPAGLQWQQLTDNGWETIPGQNGNTLTLVNVQPSPVPVQIAALIDGGACFQISSEPVFLVVVPNPTAEFSVTPSGNGQFEFVSSAVDFTGGPVWDFGDGSEGVGSTVAHSFLANGTYTVTMSVWNQCDTATYTQTVEVALPPLAGFTVEDTLSACNQVMVPFLNNSTDAVSYQWLFPGGMPTVSNEPSPTVVYAVSGTYNATLIVTNAAGSDTIQQPFVVSVLSFPSATFSYDDLPDGPFVQFEFTGVGALLYQWDFGDGSPISNEASPYHVFPGMGTYTVRLIVQNECGASILELPIEVVDETIATDGPATGAPVLVWPNPTTGRFQIAPTDGVEWAYIVGADGKVLRRLDLQSGQCCAVWDLPSGVYGLHLVGSKGITVLRLVKM